ncbi:MAG: 4Fe-4S dicluster domain-containing protein [Nitrososphaerota archaeon]|nr:4Fe-4S dicluster domain-containing protein [Nitrososphaerota archaeon]
MNEVILWLLALPMAYAVAWVVKRSSDVKSPADLAYAFFLLVMMASMYAGAIIYLLNSTTFAVVEAVALNMSVMTVGILVVLKYWISEQTVRTDTATESSAGEISLEQSVTISNAYVIFFVVFLASMTATGLIYIIDSSSFGLEVALGAGTVIMTIGVLAILRYAMQHGKLIQEREGPLQLSRSSSGKLATIALVLINEFFMGWAFVLASEPSAIHAGLNFTNLLQGFNYVVSSYWFIFIMALEMGLTILMVRRNTPKSLIVLLALQASVMLFSPPAIRSQFWESISAYVGSGLMTVLFVFCYEYLYRNKMIGKQISQYFVRVIIIYALMMAGLFFWLVYSNYILFALSIVLEMGIYFNAVLSRSSFKESQLRSWTTDGRWVFTFLAATFVAEFFMGGLIDVVYYGKDFIASVPFVAISGSIALMISASLYDFLSTFAAITGSAWYLVMMGTEMGALVFFKIRQTRELETRIRLVLVIIAYAFYTVFLPYFFFSGLTLPRIPFIGWNMGIGTSGAIAPAFIGAIAGTYLISGTLSFLFGGRQVCSMFCSASLMYQGTFPDSLKVFNRSSTVGKKLLTSKMNNIYKIVSSSVIASLIIASLISYMNSIQLINITIYGGDVASFLYIFYFDFLWYIIFLAMPFIGVYGCVTTGMCHWGLFNRLVGRLGFFKLKVRDPNRCVSCETKDCAKACPVGITDLPSSFISKGEFKSHKCIGVGDCVSSCPYENEYFYDARNWFRKVLGMKSDVVNTSPPLLRDQMRANKKLEKL